MLKFDEHFVRSGINNMVVIKQGMPNRRALLLTPLLFGVHRTLALRYKV